MRILFVVTECYPFIKTGGLADVAGALPKALEELDTEVRVLMPRYGALKIDTSGFRTSYRWDDLMGSPAQILSGRVNGLNVDLLDSEPLFARTGNPYVQDDGTDWPDNHLRFAALSLAAATLASEGFAEWQPDIVHINDWHTGLVPLYLAKFRDQGRNAPPCIATIHNILYQGLFPATHAAELGLPESGPLYDACQHFGKISFLKAALSLADKITTVSPTYATELLTPDFGMGLDGLLQTRRTDLHGILNGIDLEGWDPETDPLLEANFSQTKAVAGRAQNKAAVQAVFGLEPKPDRPLISVISRLTEQKGLDMVIDALPAIINSGARMVVLGTGDRALENEFQRAAETYPEDIGVKIAYDEDLAHVMQGGADAILIPSRFEPCGLTQLCAMRYGCLPVVSRVGGLADTVIDANAAAISAGAATGIQFSPVNAGAIADAVHRLVRLYEDKKIWRRMVRNAMRQPVGWSASASAYLSLYRTASDSSA